jgi:hypothetical protein
MLYGVLLLYVGASVPPPWLLVFDDVLGACSPRIERSGASSLRLPEMPSLCSQVEVAIDAHGTRALIRSRLDENDIAEIDLFLGIWSPLPMPPCDVHGFGYDEADRPAVIAPDDSIFFFWEEEWRQDKHGHLQGELARGSIESRRDGPYATMWSRTEKLPSECPLPCSNPRTRDVTAAVPFRFGTLGGGSIYACGRLRSHAAPPPGLRSPDEFVGVLEAPLCFEGTVINDEPLLDPFFAYKDGYLLVGERAGHQRLIHLATGADTFTHVAGKTYLINDIPPQAANSSQGTAICPADLQYALLVTVVPPASDARVTYSVGLGKEASAPCRAAGTVGSFVCGSRGGPYHIRASAAGYAETLRDVYVPDDGCHPISQQVSIELAPPP